MEKVALRNALQQRLDLAGVGAGVRVGEPTVTFTAAAAAEGAGGRRRLQAAVAGGDVDVAFQVSFFDEEGAGGGDEAATVTTATSGTYNATVVAETAASVLLVLQGLEESSGGTPMAALHSAYVEELGALGGDLQRASEATLGVSEPPAIAYSGLYVQLGFTMHVRARLLLTLPVAGFRPAGAPVATAPGSAGAPVPVPAAVLSMLTAAVAKAGGFRDDDVRDATSTMSCTYVAFGGGGGGSAGSAAGSAGRAGSAPQRFSAECDVTTGAKLAAATAAEARTVRTGLFSYSFAHSLVHGELIRRGFPICFGAAAQTTAGGTAADGNGDGNGGAAAVARGLHCGGAELLRTPELAYISALAVARPNISGLAFTPEMRAAVAEADAAAAAAAQASMTAAPTPFTNEAIWTPTRAPTPPPSPANITAAPAPAESEGGGCVEFVWGALDATSSWVPGYPDEGGDRRGCVGMLSALGAAVMVTCLLPMCCLYGCWRWCCPHGGGERQRLLGREGDEEAGAASHRGGKGGEGGKGGKGSKLRAAELAVLATQRRHGADLKPKAGLPGFVSQRTLTAIATADSVEKLFEKSASDRALREEEAQRHAARQRVSEWESVDRDWHEGGRSGRGRRAVEEGAADRGQGDTQRTALDERRKRGQAMAANQHSSRAPRLPKTPSYTVQSLRTGITESNDHTRVLI